MLSATTQKDFLNINEFVRFYPLNAVEVDVVDMFCFVFPLQMDKDYAPSLPIPLVSKAERTKLKPGNKLTVNIVNTYNFYKN